MNKRGPKELPWETPELTLTLMERNPERLHCAQFPAKEF